MKGCLLLLAGLLLAACANEVRDESAAETHAAEIEALQRQVEAHEKRIESLQQQVADCIERLEAAQRELEQARERTAELERQLELARAAATDPEQMERLQDEVARARAARSEAEQNLRTLQSTNADLLSDLEAARSAIEEFASGSQRAALMMADAGDPESLAANLEVQPVAGDAFELKKVYYATNRVRLVRSFGDYFKPFLLPLVVLAVTLLMLGANRRYIKNEYQKRVRIGVGVVGGAITLVTAGLALQESLQMRQGDQILRVQYGNEIRDRDPDGTPYERGWIEVSIPRKRRAGELNAPQLTRFEFVIDPTKHFQLASIRPSTSDDFYAGLQESIAGDPDRSAFVFVHGFHNTFQDAAFRTAQMAHDMEFPGAPVFFSWPSQGSVLDYLTDSENAKTSVEHLKRFLREIHEQSGATRIHLIAHSMGSRALTNAVNDLAAEQFDGGKFGQLVLAAPDIKKDTLEQMIPALARMSAGVTLYASSYDFALLASRTLQGGDEEYYQRAGESRPRPMVAPPMQTIDVSFATRGHSYVSDSRRMLEDLAGLLSGRRVLIEQSGNFVPTSGGMGYWLLEDE